MKSRLALRGPAAGHDRVPRPADPPSDKEQPR